MNRPRHRLSTLVPVAAITAATLLSAVASARPKLNTAPLAGPPTPTQSPSLLPLDVAPEAPPGELLDMTAPVAVTWDLADPQSPTGTSYVVQLGRVNGGGGVKLQIDRTVMTARAAVVWITRAPDTVSDAQTVRVALLGDATLEQDAVKRSGPNLYVTATIRGNIRVSAPDRTARDESAGETYTVADNLRKVAETPAERLGSAVVARAAGEPVPQREVQSQDVRRAPIRFTAGFSPTVVGPDGNLAVMLSGGATIFQTRPNGDFIELRADRAVLFTTVKSLNELDEARQADQPREVVTAAYLEGDVRVTVTPASLASALGEQRLQAERVYYEFATDRAVLTDAVLHTVEPQRQLPVVFRAQTVRQLAQGEYEAEKIELSTSSFAVPTYSVRASRMYVRQTTPAYEGDRARTQFRSSNLTLNALGLPVFWLPFAGGDAQNFPLRSVGIENSDRFGFGIRTQWGLFESLGRPHPKDLDIAYRVDYLDARGPATGIDADYRGGLVTETTAEPWNFQGRVRSYFIYDRGTDEFGGQRVDVEPDRESRGQVLFEHQHFLPDDWQVQLRGGYASDATFLEQFFQSDFNTQLPYELSFYAKRQRDSEQLSLLGVTALNDFPTTADLVQEQAFVQRYPELAYRRVGDSLLGDRFTFFSDNTASVLSFKNSQDSLAEQGYSADFGPGIPSYGQTGTDEDTVFRGDLRQQLDYPVQLGQFKVVPYVVGRYSPYSDAPSGGAENRVYAAAGTRITTAFWKTDDTVQSELFDINRLRHVVEPVVNLYTSGTTVDSSKLYIYDEPIDKIYDVSAAQLRLEQRWQTKRGGPGRWRSVDVFTLNVEGNFFTNQPDDAFLEPKEFRGAWFDALPEASLPRNSINTDASWRVSDSFLVLSDAQYNLDESSLATVAGGLAIQRDPRLSYYVEQRYIDLLDSNITSFGISYQLSSKYLLNFSQAYDWSKTNNVSSAVGVQRRFDRIVAGITAYTDSVNDETGLRFLILPEGIATRPGTGYFSALGTQRR